MSQRLMFTALKSARLNGVPFGRERERNRHIGVGGRRRKIEKNKLKIELWTAKKLVNNFSPKGSDIQLTSNYAHKDIFSNVKGSLCQWPQMLKQRSIKQNVLHTASINLVTGA